MNEEQIYLLLSDLASIDTHEINLRDHPNAYAAVEAAAFPLLAEKQKLRRSLVAASNYIDTLGGVSKSYRVVLGEINE